VYTNRQPENSGRDPRPRKSPRLKEFDYIGPLATHLIFVSEPRDDTLGDPELANICIDALFEASTKHDAAVHAYCVMPDNMHVIVQLPDGVSLTKLARLFKQLSGYRLKKTLGHFAWQVSYFDHLLREEESLADVAQYIWENPVKARLAERWADYPWSGPRSAIEAESQV